MAEHTPEAVAQQVAATPVADAMSVVAYSLREQCRLPAGAVSIVLDALVEAQAQRDEELAALEGRLDSLEYVESLKVVISGYGVRQQRIAEGRAAIAKTKGGA